MELSTIMFKDKSLRCFFNAALNMWVCAKDVCAVLGYSENSYRMVLNKIDVDNKKQRYANLAEFLKAVNHITMVLCFI